MTASRARLMRAPEVADYLGIDLRTLRTYTRAKTIPAIDIRLDGAKRPTWRYDRRDLDAWLNQRRSA